MTAGTVTLNLGSGGEDIATDEIAGSVYQRVKLVDGAIDGTDAIGGDATNGLDVDVTRVSGTVTIQEATPIDVSAATVTVDLGANNDITIEGGAVLGTTGVAGPANALSIGGTESGGTFREIAVDASGNIQCDIVSISGAQVDDAAFSPGSGTVSMIGATFDDTTPDSVDEGDGGAVRMSANRNLYSTIRDAAGNERGVNVNASNQLAVAGPVTNAGTFAVQVDGDALTALQVIDNPVFADDAAFTLTSSSVMVGGAIRDDSLSTLAAVEGDAVPLRVSSTGALHVTGGGGGTEYTEDVAAAADPIGGAQILVRADTPATVTGTDGDNVARRGTNYGAAYTQIVDSSGNFVDSFGGSGGTAAADDADFTAGTTQGTPSMGVYESTPSSVTDGDMGIVGISQDRRLLTDTEVTAALPTGDNNIGNVDIASSVALDVSAATVTVDLGSNNDVTIEGGAVLGTDGAAGPANALSIGGTESGGNLQEVRVDADGHLQVDVLSGGGSGTEYTDDTSTHATGSSTGTLFMAAATPTDTSVDANDIGAVAMSADRRLHVDSQIVGQDAALDVSAATVTVSGTVTANAGTNLNTSALLTTSAHDAAFGTAGSADAQVRSVQGIASMTPLLVDATGQGNVPVDLGTNNDVQGAVAHDAAVTGNPFLLAGEARTSLPTAVANGDAVRLQADDDGRIVTQPMSPRDMINTSTNRIALTSTTRTVLVAAGGAGVFNDLVSLTMSNESATEVRVDVYDLSTGGTAIFSVDLAADGGGATINLPVPYPQATANNAWDVELSAAVSTVYITGICVERQ